MKLEKNTVKIGLEKPVRILHVTDTHIALADERDDERKRALANRLGLLFPGPPGLPAPFSRPSEDRKNGIPYGRTPFFS